MKKKRCPDCFYVHSMPVLRCTRCNAQVNESISIESAHRATVEKGVTELSRKYRGMEAGLKTLKKQLSSWECNQEALEVSDAEIEALRKAIEVIEFGRDSYEHSK